METLKFNFYSTNVCGMIGTTFSNINNSSRDVVFLFIYSTNLLRIFILYLLFLDFYMTIDHTENNFVYFFMLFKLILNE